MLVITCFMLFLYILCLLYYLLCRINDFFINDCNLLLFCIMLKNPNFVLQQSAWMNQFKKDRVK
jgi:hypothetical protein